MGRGHVDVDVSLNDYNQVDYTYRNYTKIKQRNSEQRLVDLLHRAPKIFHSYLQEKFKRCPSYDPLSGLNVNLVSDSIDRSDIFVEAFSSFYVLTVPTDLHPYQELDCLMQDFQVVYEEVRRILTNLDGSSSPGLYGIYLSRSIKIIDNLTTYSLAIKVLV